MGFDPDYEVIKKRDPLLTGLLSIGSLSSLSSSNNQSKTTSLMFVRFHKTAWLRTKHLSKLPAYRPVAARNHYRMNIVTVAHVYYEYH